jgi:hypothetical protein
MVFKMSNFDQAELAAEAYIYLYPIVVMEITRQQYAAKTRSPHDANLLSHSRNLANHKWRSVARTNIDTLASGAWLDLSKTSATMTITKSQLRFYMYQFLDMWTDTYAVIGSRTVGNEMVRLRIAHCADTAAKSDDVDFLIKSPTPTTWIIGRTYPNGDTDLADAHQHQDGVIIKYDQPDQVRDINQQITFAANVPPVEQATKLTGSEFFELASRLIAQQGVHLTDGSMSLRLRSLGFNVGELYEYENQHSLVKAAVDQAPMRAATALTSVSNSYRQTDSGWSIALDNIGTYANNYLTRAIIAKYGLAANPPEDSVYASFAPLDKRLELDGENKYLIHFEKDQIPPAKFFWSLTVYDRDGFMIPNELRRFGVRSCDNLQYGSDGSLDIYLSPIKTDRFRESNWIPTVKGVVTATIRLYGPSNHVLTGNWEPPAISQVEN